MSIYIVSYELKGDTSTSAYEPLWEALEALESHKIQRSVWLVSVNNTAKELHDHLKNYMDDNDRLWVSRVHSGEHWYSGAIKGTNDFFATHNY